MNDIVLDTSDSRRYLSMQKMQPFKRVTHDEIDYCPYGLYRALLTPVHRRLRDHDNNNLLKRTRSIFSFHLKDSYYIFKSELIHFKLLKVLELRHNEIDNFPVQILSLIWLRLWNLQTFIVHGPMLSVITFPEEIWGLMQLRHLKLPRIYLPDCPSGSVDKGRHMDFSNLQTISYLSSRCCTKEVIMGIQNVKKLRIRRDATSSGPLNNLVHLHQLETLNFTDYLSGLLPASAKAFPATLKKLKLKETGLSWSYLDIIAELPDLEVLKLMDNACLGNEWYPNVRGFTRLKVLLIKRNDLKYWKATDDNFPVLERLMIRSCYYLKEIPIEFAEIHTLQLIELRRARKQPCGCSYLLSIEEIISLHKKVSYIEAFLKNSEKQISSYGAMTDLEVRIKGFANAAEDKIEFGLREAMMAEDETRRGKAHEELCESLQQVAKDIDRVQ
ncbi:hypothetical protein BC332_24803 [Capsicum chinense]|nr:hypothetical protein BC332_24803 [Capsicum chinense]